MRLFFTNLIDADGVTITGSSEVSTLPAANVAHEFRELPWRTGASSATETITFDLGSAKAATSAILLGHTLNSGDSSIQLRGSTDNFAASNVLVATFTHAAELMAVIFNSASYRYWRVTFTKSSAAESRDIGRIYIGTYYETEEDPDYDGFNKESLDLSRTQKTTGGQTYVEQLSRYKKLKVEFSKISNTMQTNLQAYIDAVGISLSHFVQIATSSPFADYWYVRLTKAVKADVSAQDSSALWDTSLEFEEQL